MINIVYMTLLGGQFLGQIITSAIDDTNQWELYDNHIMDWSDRETLFKINPNIKITWSHLVSFKQVYDMENLVFISCNDEESLKIMQRRNKYINTSVKDFLVLETRQRYHQELYNYLIDHDKKFFHFTFNELWERKSFSNKIRECMTYLQLPFDEEKNNNAHKKWMYANIKTERQSNQGDTI